MLSAELTVDEKLGIIKTEYSIPVDDKLRKDVSAMCNLSQGIRERTVAERSTYSRTDSKNSGEDYWRGRSYYQKA